LLDLLAVDDAICDGGDRTDHSAWSWQGIDVLDQEARLEMKFKYLQLESHREIKQSFCVIVLAICGLGLVLLSVYVILRMAWVGHALEGADVLPTRSFLFFY